MAIDPNYFAIVRQIESGGNPYAYNKTTGASGLYQFIPSTARQYGGSGEAAMQRLTADNARVLASTLGREPTSGELYLAHQQGAGGASKLLKNPAARAVDLVGSAAVLNNGGTADMSAGQFARKWTSQFGENPSPDRVAPTSVAQMGDQGAIGSAGPAGAGGQMPDFFSDLATKLFNDPTNPGGSPVAKWLGINPAAAPTAIGSSVPLPGQPGMPAASGNQTPLQDLMAYFKPQTGLLGNSIIGNALRGGLAGLGSSVGVSGLGGLGAGFMGAEQAQQARQFGQQRTAAMGMEYGNTLQAQQQKAAQLAQVQNLPAPPGVDQAAWDTFKKSADPSAVLEVYGRAAFRAPPAPQGDPAAIQEYKLAQQQGFGGTFEEYQAAHKTPPDPLLHTTEYERALQTYQNSPPGSPEWQRAKAVLQQPRVAWNPATQQQDLIVPPLPDLGSGSTPQVAPAATGGAPPPVTSADIGGTSSQATAPQGDGTQAPPAATGTGGASVTPIPGQPKPPPKGTTEDARKTAQLVAEAEPQLPILEKNFDELTKISTQVWQNVPIIGNAMLSDGAQKAITAASTIMADYLYSVSGAQITEIEAQRRAALILPAFGDKAGRLDQKRQLARNMIQVMKIRAGLGLLPGQAPPAGSGADNVLPGDGQSNAAPAAPKVGDVQAGPDGQKYRFNGGDPADHNNWSPVLF